MLKYELRKTGTGVPKRGLLFSIKITRKKKLHRFDLWY